jgi:hypothetical protein
LALKNFSSVSSPDNRKIRQLFNALRGTINTHTNPEKQFAEGHNLVVLHFFTAFELHLRWKEFMTRMKNG